MPIRPSRTRPNPSKGPACWTPLGLLTLLSAGLLACPDSGPLQSARADAAIPERSSVVSMARLEPASGIIRLESATTDVVEEILVEQNEEVAQDQILVRLSGYALRAAELDAALLQLERARLEPLAVEAQQARVRAVEAELASARDEVRNQEELSEKGFTAGKEFRDAQLRVIKAEEELNETRATLERTTADASLAQREAQNQIDQAEAQVEQNLIRSPIDGRVLRVNTRAGERVGRPILSLGSTQSMVAIGEVHANEIRLVKPGQSASFASPALPEPLWGRVGEIGGMIITNRVHGEDPSAPRGLRVIQVRVELEPNAMSERLTNLEGQLRIYLEEPGSR